MDSPILSLIAAFIAMVFVIFAYFVRKKSVYLLFQVACIVFLIISYFFSLQFFAMIGLSIGLARSLTFFAFESKNKNAPVWVSCIFGSATLISYFIVNLWILGDAKPVDILCLTALVMYAFIFRIRDLKTVRFTMLVPTVISIVYNIWISAAIFTTLTYAFELGANIVSIFNYHILPQDKTKEQGEKANENG